MKQQQQQAGEHQELEQAFRWFDWPAYAARWEVRCVREVVRTRGM